MTAMALKTGLLSLTTACGLLAGTVASAAVPHGTGSVWIPDSSIEGPGDHGVAMHTNIRVLVPYTGLGTLATRTTRPTVAGLPPASGYFYETPASLGCVYGLTKSVSGCNPNVVTTAPAGGKGAIAIVDAYDNPTLTSDLAVFDAQFGLPTPNFSIVYAAGRRPSQDSTGGWEVEAALDVEWAHAMAPSAQIYLVEAASSNLGDLLLAVSVASKLVATAGGGEVSMSWGGSEFSGEQNYDGYFKTGKVVFVASAGDDPGVSYPSASPYVISAGGTGTSRNPTTGTYALDTAWQSTGGGPSVYETRPSYQASVASTVGSARGTPDVAFDADTLTGVWVYSSYAGGWTIVGGTSVAAPALSGIINAAGKLAASTTAELSTIYSSAASGTGFKPVTVGNCGPYGGFIASGSWNFCTGVGIVNGLAGK